MFYTAITLLPVFMLILSGFLIFKFWFHEEISWKLCEKLTYYIFIPALVIKDLTATDLIAIKFSDIVIALLGSVLAITIVLLFLRKTLNKHLSINNGAFTSVLQGSIRANFFITLAVAPLILGDDALALVIILIAFFTILVNIISVLTLARFGNNQKNGLSHLLKQLLKNPFIVSTVLAVVINLSGWIAPVAIEKTLNLLSGAGLPLALITAGAGLRFSNIGKHLNGLLVASFCKLIALPLISWTIGNLLGLEEIALATLVLFHSQPTAMTSYVLSKHMGGDHELMATILTMQTIFAFITVPILMTLVI
jgi:malonate transporter|tara:strand:+ start:6098 stop:7024 length:927 start_codon:yes stop_codon:yes gene_type:complete